MSDEKLPAYSAPANAQYVEKEKQKREITLFHSEMQGMIAESPATSILFPPNTTLIRIWSGNALDGIEYFAADGATGLVGNRTGSPTDHRIHPGTYITALTVRSGSWLDAIQMTFSDGTSTPWCGGQGGGHSSWSGVIVGLVAHSTQIIGKLGVITARDFNEFAQFHHETQVNGIAAAEQKEEAGPSHEHVSKGKYKWDTGRWTGNRGIGIRWNHERHRVEIYQGSNDAKNY